MNTWYVAAWDHELIDGIEGQQEMLDADPDFKMNAIVSDAPLAHFRRTLGKMIEAEGLAAELPSATARMAQKMPAIG